MSISFFIFINQSASMYIYMYLDLYLCFYLSMYVYI